MMKKMYKKMGLELDNKDNVLSAFAKGGIQGAIGFVTVALPVLTTMVIIGRCVTNKSELEKFEQESGAE